MVICGDALDKKRTWISFFYYETIGNTRRTKSTAWEDLRLELFFLAILDQYETVMRLF